MKKFAHIVTCQIKYIILHVVDTEVAFALEKVEV